MICIFVGFVLCEQCNAPNTVQTKSGACACLDGFPYGNASKSTGCWKCESLCGKNAACEYPGQCKCQDLYVGDGFTCRLEVPEIIDFTPKVGPASGGTNVTIHYKFAKSDVTAGYCRFGRYSVIGTLQSNNALVCMSPPGALHEHALSISFDGVAWSKDNTFFRYIEGTGTLSRENYQAKQKWLFISIAILCVLFLSSLIEKKPKEKSESLNPLLSNTDKRRFRRND